MPIKVSINVGKIDKSQLYEGKNGKYLNIVLWETEDDKYDNDYRCTQDISKEARNAGQKGAILGNGKNFGNTAKKPQELPTQRKVERGVDLDSGEPDEIPF